MTTAQAGKRDEIHKTSRDEARAGEDEGNVWQPGLPLQTEQTKSPAEAGLADQPLSTAAMASAT
ncbi:hypothetical protein D3C74_488670 [compost metagenome]